MPSTTLPGPARQRQADAGREHRRPGRPRHGATGLSASRSKGKPAPVIDGLTGDQRFFLAFAQAWRSKYRDGVLRQLLADRPALARPSARQRRRAQHRRLVHGVRRQAGRQAVPAARRSGSGFGMPPLFSSGRRRLSLLPRPRVPPPRVVRARATSRAWRSARRRAARLLPREPRLGRRWRAWRARLSMSVRGRALGGGLARGRGALAGSRSCAWPGPLRAPAARPSPPLLTPSSSAHLPDITRCAASATASAIISPSLVALDHPLFAACEAVSAASSPASRILRRAAGLALIAAAAAARPAASISLLIAALAILSTTCRT